MVLAVGVRAVHAECDGELAALDAVVPRAEPLLPGHLVATQAGQVVDLEQEIRKLTYLIRKWDSDGLQVPTNCDILPLGTS